MNIKTISFFHIIVLPFENFFHYHNHKAVVLDCPHFLSHFQDVHFEYCINVTLRDFSVIWVRKNYVIEWQYHFLEV